MRALLAFVKVYEILPRYSTLGLFFFRAGVEALCALSPGVTFLNKQSGQSLVLEARNEGWLLNG